MGEIGTAPIFVNTDFASLIEILSFSTTRTLHSTFNIPVIGIIYVKRRLVDLGQFFGLCWWRWSSDAAKRAVQLDTGRWAQGVLLRGVASYEVGKQQHYWNRATGQFRYVPPK